MPSACCDLRTQGPPVYRLASCQFRDLYTRSVKLEKALTLTRAPATTALVVIECGKSADTVTGLQGTTIVYSLGSHCNSDCAVTAAMFILFMSSLLSCSAMRASAIVLSPYVSFAGWPSCCRQCQALVAPDSSMFTWIESGLKTASWAQWPLPSAPGTAVCMRTACAPAQSSRLSTLLPSILSLTTNAPQCHQGNHTLHACSTPWHEVTPPVYLSVLTCPRLQPVMATFHSVRGRGPSVAASMTCL